MPESNAGVVVADQIWKTTSTLLFDNGSRTSETVSTGHAAHLRTMAGPSYQAMKLNFRDT